MRSLNQLEERAYRKGIKETAKKHGIPVETVYQVAGYIVRDGVPYDDMWGDLDDWCSTWSGKVK